MQESDEHKPSLTGDVLVYLALVALILDEPAGTARKLVPFAVLSRLLGAFKDGKAPTWSQDIEQSFRIERTITILNLLEWESPDQRALRRSKLQKICYNS